MHPVGLKPKPHPLPCFYKGKKFHLARVHWQYQNIQRLWKMTK